MPRRQKTQRVGPSVLNIEPYDGNTHLQKIKAWEVSEKSNNDVQGCFENIIGSVITKTVEEESFEYEEDCERRRRQIEEIVIENKSNIQWVFGLFGNFSI